jgi:hypothetical protein
MLHGLRFQELADRQYYLGRKQQLLRAGVLKSLGLDDYMSRAKPHSVRNRLLVATIEQAQRDQ